MMNWEDLKMKHNQMVYMRCVFNTGEGLSEESIAIGDSVDSKYPIKLGEIYNVYGQNLYKGTLGYLILGTYENLPSWYPAELFEVVDSLCPLEWYFQYEARPVLNAIWGYKELVLEPSHYDDLIDREDKAVRIFLKRKKEIDESE